MSVVIFRWNLNLFKALAPCDRFTLYYLREETPTRFIQTSGYEASNRSEVLPELDIDLLSECVRNPNPLAAAKEFRLSLAFLMF